MQVIVNEKLILVVVMEPYWDAILIVYFKLACLLISQAHGGWQSIKIEIVAIILANEVSKVHHFAVIVGFRARIRRVLVNTEDKLQK